MSSQEVESRSEPSARGLRKARAPIVVVLALLLALGGCYLLYVKANASSLRSRNFRLLAAMGLQVSKAVASEAKVLDNLGLDGARFRNEVLGKTSGRPRMPQPVRCAGAAALAARPSDLPPAQTRPIFESLEPSDGYLVDFRDSLGNCAAVPLKEMLEPIFLARKAFTTVLLADEQGEVLYQYGPPEIGIHRLDKLVEPPGFLGPKGAKSLMSQDLTGTSREIGVEIVGRTFRLFVRPVTPFREPAAQPPAGPHRSPRVWLLCGLVPSDEIDYANLAVSPSYLAAAVAMLLLCLLSWPLLKLKLLGERQRIRGADLLTLTLCSLLGVSLLTLFLLDLYHRRELERIADRQTQRFASLMESNFETEIRRAYVQLAALEHAAIPALRAAERLGDLKGVVDCYPSFESFSLIDGQGQQKLKWSAEPVARPAINVAARPYFKRTSTGDLWQLPDRDPRSALAVRGCAAADLNRIGPFVLESIVSSITGVRQAVLAKPVKDPTSGIAVAALALPMLSVIQPVIPPGFEYAVIDDENGQVLFHSDAERNLVENLFAETDQDRHLRSAVFARRSETMDVRYWGEDFKASLRPLRGLPWTIVALQHKDPLENANLASVLTALVLISLYVGMFALVLATVALVRPAYRAAWLWPAPERSNDYVRLVLLYVLLCAAFAAAILLVAEGLPLVTVGWLLPLFSLIAGYIQLTRHDRRWPRLLAQAAGVGLLCLLLGAFLAPSKHAWRRLPLVLTVLTVGFLVYVHPTRWRRLTRRGDVPVSLSYPAVGLLLLLLTAVLPTVCFFKTAQEIQTDCLVKHGQLKLAKALQQRRILPADPSLALSFYGEPFFDTHFTHFAAHRDKSPPAVLLPFLEPLLPTYSTSSAETRELLHAEASDGGWYWKDGVKGDHLVLVGAGLGFNLVSSLPGSWLSAAEPASASGRGAGAFTAGAAVAVGILFLALLAALACFISRHLFLVDLFEPLWSGRHGALPPTVGSNVFLVSRREEWHLRDSGQSFFRLHCKDLEADPPGWPGRLLDLHGSLPDRNVLVEGFEHRIFDPAFNDRKLALLEDLAAHRTVVVLSTTSPALLFARQAGTGAAGGSPGTEERWRTLLASFTLIDEDLWPQAEELDPSSVTVRSVRELRRLLRHGRRRKAAAAGFVHLRSRLLGKECGRDPFLLQIGRELDRFAGGLDRRQLLEELGERAESYYRSLWANCSNDEKVVLGHLAEDGLVNEKSRRMVRRLMARGLVQRQPIFRLMNETFRRFVLSPACHCQVQDLEESAATSPWDRFRRPFFGVLAAGAVFFLATQRELLDGTTAIVTAFTAGLPVLVKVADFLGSRRAAPAGK